MQRRALLFLAVVPLVGISIWLASEAFRTAAGETSAGTPYPEKETLAADKIKGAADSVSRLVDKLDAMDPVALSPLEAPAPTADVARVSRHWETSIAQARNVAAAHVLAAKVASGMSAAYPKEPTSTELKGLKGELEQGARPDPAGAELDKVRDLSVALARRIEQAEGREQKEEKVRVVQATILDVKSGLDKSIGDLHKKTVAVRNEEFARLQSQLASIRDDLTLLPTAKPEHDELVRRVSFFQKWNPGFAMKKPADSDTLEKQIEQLVRLVGAAPVPQKPDETEWKDVVEQCRSTWEADLQYDRFREKPPAALDAWFRELKTLGERASSNEAVRVKLQKTVIDWIDRTGLPKRTRPSLASEIKEAKGMDGKFRLGEFTTKAGGGFYFWRYDLVTRMVVYKSNLSNRETLFDNDFAPGWSPAPPTEYRLFDRLTESRSKVLAPASIAMRKSWEAFRNECDEMKAELATYLQSQKSYRLIKDLDFDQEIALADAILEHWDVIENLFRK